MELKLRHKRFGQAELLGYKGGEGWWWFCRLVWHTLLLPCVVCVLKSLFPCVVYMCRPLYIIVPSCSMY